MRDLETLRMMVELVKIMRSKVTPQDRTRLMKAFYDELKADYDCVLNEVKSRHSSSK